MKLKFSILIGILAAAAAVFIIINYKNKNLKLSEKPERAPAGATSEFIKSSIEISAEIKYSAIEQAVEKGFPVQIAKKGGGRHRTFPLRSFIGPGPAVSVDYTWAMLVEREKVSIQKNGAKIRANVPVKVTGWGGLRGTLAKWTGLNRKNVRGALTVSLDIDPDINESMELRLSPEPSFKWTRTPQIEVLGGVWIDLPTIDDDLRKALNDAAGQIQNSIPKDILHKVVTSEWKIRKLELGEIRGIPVSLTVIPDGLGFSGVQFGDDKILLSVLLECKCLVNIGLGESSPVLAEIPKLKRIPIGSNLLRITVPVRMPYTEMVGILKAETAGKFFTGRTVFGDSKLQVEDVEMFPAGGSSLACGLKIKASFEKKLLDVGGWIWLTANPSVNSNQDSIQFSKVEFTRKLDNDVWEAATILLREPIGKALNSGYSIRAGEILKGANKQIMETILGAVKKEGVKLELKNPKLTIGKITVLTDSLQPDLDFTGSAQVEVIKILN